MVSLNVLKPSILRASSRQWQTCLTWRLVSRQHTSSASSLRQEDWSTPLARTIGQAIQTTGPISIAAYMRQCLTSPDGGYYTTHRSGRDKANDPFGTQGDFTTSPEISQIFGELIGLWFVTEWMAQGRPKHGVTLVELGPGRGTLMNDMLRSIGAFKDVIKSVQRIYLVEASPGLRQQQFELLCGKDAKLEEIAIGHQSMIRDTQIPVVWCEDIRTIPKEPTAIPFMLAHEFFDALPIHAFQSVVPANCKDTETKLMTPTGSITLNNSPRKKVWQAQWRELLVSNVIDKPGASKKMAESDRAQFELSVAKASTPSSIVLPASSPRYAKLLPKSGSTIEICPEGRIYAAEMAQRIGNPDKSNGTGGAKGAALIIDYGPLDTVPIASLRGIRAHKRTASPFVSPGQVDLSADVDFCGLAEAAVHGSEGVEVHGPVEQGKWLDRMGIGARANILKQKLGNAEDQARIQSAVDRLVDRSTASGMGRVYKVISIIPNEGGTRRPVGFGGSVVEA